MRIRSRSGFTLIELLVVLVIIMLLLALILPHLFGAMCAAKEATAQVLISELTTAAQSYWIAEGRYPPGDGSGSDDLAYALSHEGPRKLPYFDFVPAQLWRGHIRNPVWDQAGAPRNILYYRNNQQVVPVGLPPVPQPPIYRKKSGDLWGAGCAWTEEDPSTSWSLKNW